MNNTEELIEAILEQLDPLQLECDGMTSALSTLLARAGIEHSVCAGFLDISGTGAIPLHCWVELPDGKVCDLRAQAWLGASASVPHGMFLPTRQQHYEARVRRPPASWGDAVFHAVTGRPVADFPGCALEGQAHGAN